METNDWVMDEFGVKYSQDWETLIAAPANLWEYSVREGTRVIGEVAFDDCYINDIKIPEGVEVIGIDAFHWCTDLKSVKLPSSLKRIEEGAFCGAPIESIEFPEGLESLGAIVFTSRHFERIVLPESLIHIDGNPFAGCRIDEFICKSPHFRVQDDMLIQDDRLIAVLKDTDTVNIPREVRHICSYAISCCDSLRELIVPEWIESIDPNGLPCRNLLKVYFPAAMNGISEEVFRPFRNPEMIFESVYEADLRREGEDLRWKLTSLGGEHIGLDKDIWIWAKTKYPGEKDSELGTPRVYVGRKKLYAVSIGDERGGDSEEERKGGDEPRSGQGTEWMDRLSPEDMGMSQQTADSVIAWVRRHRTALLRHWYGKTSSCGLIDELGF